MTYEKLLNEIYAAVSLKYLWQEYKPGFVKSESPDWINEAMDLGLEVSQALLPDDGQEERFIEKYLGCLKEELPDSAMERYGDRLHFYNGRFWAVLPASDTERDCVYKTKYRFSRKLEKLNTNYQHRRYNGLYLFVHPAQDEEIDAYGLFTYMGREQEKCSVRFDWIFLNCGSVIHICNYIRNELETISLPKNAENFLDSEAERLRQSIVWENGASIENDGKFRPMA